jgi:branched-subunit amino acid ABC-type transport system permease component
LLSVGLTLIFGMLDVINLAHGSFYMLGAYAGLSLIAATDNFWLALLAAPLAVGLIGALIERSCLRPLYRRPPLDQVLLTFGFIYLFEDVVKWIWGGRIRSIPPPELFSGSVSLGGTIIPSYRLFVIVFGLVMAVLLYVLIERTRLGAVIRAGVFDAEMTAGMGINIHRVFTAVFAFGAALGGLSGVIAGPIQSAFPSMGVTILIPALIVVVVGGLGSLKGSLIGSLIIGQAETFGKAWLPDAAMLIIYVVMATVMLLRPQGLFGRPLK